MFKKYNLDGYKELLPGVGIKSLVHGKKTHMTRVILTEGSVIPNHDHIHEQTGILLSGRIILQINDDTFEVEPGDHWCIPGSTPHSAQAIERSEIIEVFSPIRNDYLAL